MKESSEMSEKQSGLFSQISNSIMRYLYDLKESKWGMAFQRSPWAHRLFDELGRGFLLPLLGIPVDLDVRIALGGRRHEPELKTDHPINECEFNLLFIQPPLPDNLRQKRLVPIGIAALAAFLRRELKAEAFNVGILDAQAQNLSIAEILPMVTAHRWDAIGIGFMTVQADISKNLARALRTLLPHTLLLAGGNHPTAAPESVAMFFDYLFMGESEWTLLEWTRRIIKKQNPGNIPGMVFLGADGALIRTPDRPLEKSLDAFPDIAWDLLPVHSYDWPLHVVGGRRLPIMASRGCPYACTFCGSPNHWRRQVRYRSANRVFEEIKHLQREFKTDYFHFKDDNFGINADFVQNFCNLVIEADLGITWICTDRASHTIRNRALLPIMRKAGCIGIEIGIESADPQSYIEVNKEQDVLETHEAIKLQRQAGMVPQYTYMVFSPGETLLSYYNQKTFFDTIHAGMTPPRFFQPLPFPLYVGQFATVYPNTGFAATQSKLGLNLLDDQDLGHHFNITFLPYSLLEDIPFWRTSELQRDDFILFGIGLWQAFYAQFPGRLTNRRLTMHIWEGMRGMASFFRNCDGTRTLQKVAARVSDELNWHLHKALRISTLTAYFFAQQGLVCSAVHGRNALLPVRRVRIPGFKKRIINFLLWKYAPESLNGLVDF